MAVDTDQKPLFSLSLLRESESLSVVSDSLRPHGLHSPWDSLGQNPGVGSLSLLQGIFPTQGLNPGLPYCRRILYQLSHKGSAPVNSLSFSFLICETVMKYLIGQVTVSSETCQDMAGNYHLSFTMVILTKDYDKTILSPAYLTYMQSEVK